MWSDPECSLGYVDPQGGKATLGDGLRHGAGPSTNADCGECFLCFCLSACLSVWPLVCLICLIFLTAGLLDIFLLSASVSVCMCTSPSVASIAWVDSATSVVAVSLPLLAHLSLSASASQIALECGVCGWQEELIKCIDFKHITDVITPKAALELLKAVRPGHEQRKAQMKAVGYPVRSTRLLPAAAGAAPIADTTGAGAGTPPLGIRFKTQNDRA